MTLETLETAIITNKQRGNQMTKTLYKERQWPEGKWVSTCITRSSVGTNVNVLDVVDGKVYRSVFVEPGSTPEIGIQHDDGTDYDKFVELMSYRLQDTAEQYKMPVSDRRGVGSW